MVNDHLLKKNRLMDSQNSNQDKFLVIFSSNICGLFSVLILFNDYIVNSVSTTIFHNSLGYFMKNLLNNPISIFSGSSYLRVNPKLKKLVVFFKDRS